MNSIVNIYSKFKMLSSYGSLSAKLSYKLNTKCELLRKQCYYYYFIFFKYNLKKKKKKKKKKK